jgi:xylulokinase
VPVEKIRLGGGGARSPLWRQIQADVYNRAVEIIAAEEGAAFGAAILAGVGAGLWPGVDEACDQAIHASESIACQPQVAKLMNERYRDYQRLYPALRSLHSQEKANA